MMKFSQLYLLHMIYGSQGVDKVLHEYLDGNRRMQLIETLERKGNNLFVHHT